jgi:hypothetical protein
MTAMRLRETTLFRCNICGNCHVEENAAKWQERRTPYMRAKDLGWRFERKNGRYEAFCPDCTSAGGYSPDDVLA